MNTNSRIKNTVFNTFVGIFNRFFNLIFSFILRTIFIYTLGIQYTGVSSVFTDILTMLSLSELGIGTAIATALYVPLKNKNKNQIQKLMKFYKNAYKYIAIFIFVVGVILLPFLDFIISDVPDIKENIYVIFMLYILKTSLSYLFIYKTTIVNADQKQYIIKGYEMIGSLIRYLVEIVALLVFRNFIIYLMLEVFTTVIQNIIVTKKSVKEYGYAFEKTDDKLSKEETREIFKDIKGLSMYKISGTIGNSIDNILVSSFISTTTVGFLSNYTMIRKQIEVILSQFFNSVTPSIGNLVAEGNIEKQKSIFYKIFYISFVVVNFCGVSLFVLLTPFIELWLGKEYVLSQTISFILAFDFFLYILLQAVASFRTANGLFRKGQYRPLCTAIINIILSIILIQRWGVFGTILATVVARIVTQWYDIYILFKNIFCDSFKSFYCKYLKYILIYILSCLVTFIISQQIHISLLIDFILKTFICCLIPNILVVLFTFKTTEFDYLKKIILKKINDLFKRGHNEVKREN